MTATPPPPKRRFRRRTIVLMIALVVSGVAGVTWWASLRSLDRAVVRAVSEADRLDPGWRLPDLLKSRKTVPPGNNSAEIVAKARSLLPSNWSNPGLEEIFDRRGTRPPNQRLTDPQAATVRSVLKEQAGALRNARRLADAPLGRFPLKEGVTFATSSLEHLQDARQVAALLSLDVKLRAHDGDLDGALESCRALLNTARAIGDEPLMISQLVRIAIDGTALEAVQTVLAQGEPSESALASIQAALEDEADEPRLLWGLRGERANAHDVCSRWTSGEMTVSQSSGQANSDGPFWFAPARPFYFRATHALMLSMLNQAVEIARRPPPEQPSGWAEWTKSVEPPKDAGSPSLGFIAHATMASIVPAGRATFRITGQLRSGVVLVAAERHRQAHGDLPGTIEAIDPKFLPRRPIDPFDGRPIKLRAFEDGVSVYSVGRDGIDDGGTFGRLSERDPGYDIGSRLWKVEQRRQPPPLPELPDDVFQQIPDEEGERP